MTPLGQGCSCPMASLAGRLLDGMSRKIAEGWITKALDEHLGNR